MAGSGGTSRFAVTCALLRQYMRKHQERQEQTAGDLARLFQGPPTALPVAPDDKDDRTMQLFPVRASTLNSGQEIIRPEVTDKQAPMAIFCDEVPQAVDETQMRTASLDRFLEKRKIRIYNRTARMKITRLYSTLYRISEANPDHDDDSTPPPKKHKGAAAGKTFLDDVPDPSWLSL